MAAEFVRANLIFRRPVSRDIAAFLARSPAGARLFHGRFIPSAAVGVGCYNLGHGRISRLLKRFYAGFYRPEAVDAD
jgi:hypothetical protein